MAESTNTPQAEINLATRLADPGDEVMEHLIEGDFGDPRDMQLWQREHLAAVIEFFRDTPAPPSPHDATSETRGGTDE